MSATQPNDDSWLNELLGKRQCGFCSNTDEQCDDCKNADITVRAVIQVKLIEARLDELQTASRHLIYNPTSFAYFNKRVGKLESQLKGSVQTEPPLGKQRGEG